MAGPPRAGTAGTTPGQALGGAPLLTAAVLLVGALVGSAVATLRPVEPVARVEVLLDVDGAPASAGAAIQARQEARLARSPVVARDAARAAGLREPGDRVDVVLPNGARSLRLTVRAPTPPQAERGVLAAVQSYQSLRQVEQQRRADAQVAQYAALARALQASPTRDPGTLDELAVRWATALSSRGAPGGTGQVVLPVRVERPGRGTPARGAATGLLAAVLPALLLGHARQLHGRRLRHPSAVAELLEAPVLGVLRERRGGRLALDRRSRRARQLLAAQVVPHGPRADGDTSPPLLAVVAPGATGTLASTVTAGLALALAEGLRHVLVVEGATGTAGRVLDQAGVDTAPSHSGMRRPGRVDVLAVGSAWNQAYPWDVGLVDAPLLLASGDALRTTAPADAFLAVVPHGTARADLYELLWRVRQVRLPLRGVVYVRPRRLRVRGRQRDPALRSRSRLRRSPVLAAS